MYPHMACVQRSKRMKLGRCSTLTKPARRWAGLDNDSLTRLLHRTLADSLLLEGRSVRVLAGWRMPAEYACSCSRSPRLVAAVPARRPHACPAELERARPAREGGRRRALPLAHAAACTRTLLCCYRASTAVVGLWPTDTIN